MHAGRGRGRGGGGRGGPGRGEGEERRPYTFAAAAALGHAAHHRDPLLAPVDRVVALCPTLQYTETLALYTPAHAPQISCAESVLRLALTRVGSHGEYGDFPVCLHTDIPPGGLTLPQMVRRLRRMQHYGVGDFPVYVAVPGREIRYALAHGLPRKDYYAIVYLPPDVDGVGFPAEAHWAFMLVQEEPEPPPEPTVPVMIYTKMPVITSELIYWRCQPTPENATLFTESELRGQACSCCQQIICWHEAKWRLKWWCRSWFDATKRSARVTMMTNHIIRGCYRATFRGGLQVPGWRISAAAQNGLSVVLPDGRRNYIPGVRNNECIVNLGYFLGYFPNLFSPADRAYYRVKMGWRWFCEHFTCSFKAYEQPLQVGDFVVPPYLLHGRAYGRKPLLERVIGVLTSPLRLTWHVTMAYITALLWGNAVVMVEKMLMPWRKLDLKVSPLPTKAVGRYGGPLGLDVQGLKSQAGDVVSHAVKQASQKGFADVFYKGLGDRTVDYWYQTTKFLLPGELKNRFITSTTLGVLACGLGLLMIRRHFYQYVMTAQPDRAFGALQGLRLQFPRAEEIISRLGLLEVVTRADAVDRVRRICNEERWPNVIDRDEFQAWLEVVVTQPGKMTLVPGVPKTHCITCRQKKPTYRQECKECKRERVRKRPPPRMLEDSLVIYVGRIGIWSKRPNVLDFELKEEAYIKLRNGRILATRSAIKEWYDRQPIITSCRGWNSGPVFYGVQPECFPRGEAVGVLAFCLRLGVKRLHESDERAWKLVEAVMRPEIEPLEPESREEFLGHFSGDKLAKMLEAEQALNNGDGEEIITDNLFIIARMKGFVKAEKKDSLKFVPNAEGWRKDYYESKPRLICSPSPTALLQLGPYTHRQTKWLAERFHCRSRLYYAGCSSPDEMDTFLRNVISEMGEFGVIVDDISSIDSNHSARSFQTHFHTRRQQFGNMPKIVEFLYQAIEKIKLKIGSVKCYVQDVNASGVSDTSYKNTWLCLIIRLCALAHAIMNLFTMSTSEAYEFVTYVRRCVMTSAAGDDGYSAVPPRLCGVEYADPVALQRYSEFWAACGFSVKVAYIPPQRWRMATYLAARPVWNGTDYSWMPEPARRLKFAFWQIDNPMHPNAWAKGIAKQLQTVASCQPLIRAIADFVYFTIDGPEAITSCFDNPYSPWASRTQKFEVTERAVAEFELDYGLPHGEFQRFVQMLKAVETPYVEFRGFMMERVFAEES